MSTEVVHQEWLHGSYRVFIQLPPWVHTILHDLDSIWWVCVWATLVWVPHGRTPTNEDLGTFHRLFPTLRQADAALRSDVTQNPVTFGRLLPSYHQPIWDMLQDMRSDLTTSFREYQFLPTPLKPQDEIVLLALEQAITHASALFSSPEAATISRMNVRQ